MEINPLKITFYRFTGYSPNDEPANDSVIDLNAHWDMPVYIKEYNPHKLTQIKVQINDSDMETVDYLKITDTVTNERFYFYVLNHVRLNEKVVVINIRLDAFATVGLENISFFGNISRRSLSAAESNNYPRLPEPWAPRRPLKVRRIIIDVNTGKTVRIPTHISTTFEESETEITDTETINVPNSPLGISTFEDSLSVNALLPVGYPNPAGDTEHTVNTPWGTTTYTTPYETYYTLSGNALSTFLEKAKKYNALDLIEAPYYLPNPANTETVTITEFNNAEIKNRKAYKYYTVMTIRSLAGNQTKTYDDNNTDLQLQQDLAVIVVPDKNGGIYVIPTTIRDTGLNAYTYLDGVYSPFETVLLNAIGDTPAKFAADGTNILNNALNNLFQTYINKTNALQMEGMQAKYFKDIGTVKSVALAFFAEVLGTISTTTTNNGGYWQNSTTNAYIPGITQTQNITQTTNGYTQNQNTHTTIPAYNSTQNTYTNPINTAQNLTLASNYSRGYVNQPGYYTNTTLRSPSYTQNMTGTITVPNITTRSTGTITITGYNQNSTQNTYVNSFITNATTNTPRVTRSINQGNQIAVGGISDVYEIPQTDAWGTLKTLLFGGYRNEVHSFMLGNINDYLNRWVSIQNDLHNGKVANLFKNITLVGNYQDYNRLAGKYEILITSLQDDDVQNFDLFLQHFGHAVDEYTTTLVKDVNSNFNYSMVGDDAILTNSVSPDMSADILNQFRTGVRVWKTLIRPENY